MKFKQRTLEEIAQMICGNYFDDYGHTGFFIYRKGTLLTRFFKDCDTNFQHDGTTREKWVAGVLEAILKEQNFSANTPPAAFVRIIKVLMDSEDAINEEAERPRALAMLNKSLVREGFEAFYGDDKKCYLKHKTTNTIANIPCNIHRPFSQEEVKRREQLNNYLSKASEDEITLEILLPLFRQLGFQRITVAGHKDKALEYGKDIWMKYTLPTSHVLYFGIQVKKGKLDSAGDTKLGNTNIAGIYNQALMMLGHEIFDPEINNRVLVDHAFIISGGEITKQAKNWLGNKLDATKRSQVMFMGRDDILNLYVVHGLQLPAWAITHCS